MLELKVVAFRMHFPFHYTVKGKCHLYFMYIIYIFIYMTLYKDSFSCIIDKGNKDCVKKNNSAN